MGRGVGRTYVAESTFQKKTTSISEGLTEGVLSSAAVNIRQKLGLKSTLRTLDDVGAQLNRCLI